MFADIKTKLKSFFGKKDIKQKSTKKEDLNFVAEHIEEFKFFVKYFPVYKDIAIKVGNQEIARLDAEKPCEFREKCDTPFRCKCIIKVDGTECKTIKECKECKASKPKE